MALEPLLGLVGLSLKLTVFGVGGKISEFIKAGVPCLPAGMPKNGEPGEERRALDENWSSSRSDLRARGES